MTLPLSVLDLAPIASGSQPGQAVRNSLDLARLTDRLGFTRYWVAEHHSIPGVASTAPEVLIGHVAQVTERIRVGSGDRKSTRQNSSHMAISRMPSSA